MHLQKRNCWLWKHHILFSLSSSHSFSLSLYLFLSLSLILKHLYKHSHTPVHNGLDPTPSYAAYTPQYYHQPSHNMPCKKVLYNILYVNNFWFTDILECAIRVLLSSYVIYTNILYTNNYFWKTVYPPCCSSQGRKLYTALGSQPILHSLCSENSLTPPSLSPSLSFL